MRRIIKNSTSIFSWRQKNILSAAIVLMVMIAVSSILGLMRNRLLAGAFFSGQERLLDIYFAAFRLPDMIYQLLVLGALSAAFIPIFSEYLQKDKHKAYQLTSATINIGMLIFVMLATIVFVAAYPLCRLIAPKFNPVELTTMVKITRWLLLAQAFFVLSSFLTGVLQSFERFLLPAVSAVVYNLSIIFGILFLVKYFSIYGVVFGVLVGAFLHFAIQVPLVRNLGFKYCLNFSLNTPGVKRFFKLMAPRVLSLLITQINLSVLILIATSLSAGALALFSFAQNIIALPVSMFGLTIGQASLPSLAREAKQNKDKFKQVFLQSFTQIVYMALPASIILIVLRIPVVRLVLGAKNFPWEATVLTGKLVAVLALSVIWQSLIQLLIRLFYALQDTKTPLWVNFLAVATNIGLGLYLVFGLGWGITGLALASALAACVHGLVLIIVVKVKLTGWFDNSFVFYIAKILFINAVLAGVLWGQMRLLDIVLDTTRTANLIILTVFTLLVSLVLYVGLSWWLHIKEVKSLYQVLRRFGRWRQIFSQSEEILEGQTARPSQIGLEQN